MRWTTRCASCGRFCKDVKPWERGARYLCSPCFEETLEKFRAEWVEEHPGERVPWFGKE